MSKDTELLKAIEFENIERVKTLLNEGANINFHDANGNTPIILACMKNNLGLAKFLIENGADVNAITQAVVYLATAPKSNSLYTAHKQASHDAKKYSSLMPPKHILNAPTKLMKEEGV